MKIRYECGKCGSQWNTEAGAKQCEESHAEIIKCTPIEYRERHELPSRIEITFRSKIKTTKSTYYIGA